MKILDDRPIIWLDIDNTLYPASAKVADAMCEKIHDYFFENEIGITTDEISHLPEAEAVELRHQRAGEFHKRYYTEYGLALRGLVLYHNVDAIDFDKKCDRALQLEDMIKADETVIQLLEDIDRSRYRVWALTNAYKHHAERVLKILGLGSLIEQVVYCNYGTEGNADVGVLVCKPDPDYYRYALEQAHVTDPSLCYFVDDSRRNLDAAKELGWGHCVHLRESTLDLIEGGRVDTGHNGNQVAVEGDVVVIDKFQDLRIVWPEIFKRSP